MREFKVNDYITLKLEDNNTIIYVAGRRFRQCKQLILNIPIAEMTILSENILNIVNLLEDIIQGKADGKVRIFPLYDTGKQDLGYQYYRLVGSLRKIKWLFKDPSYVDINLGTVEARYKLVHIAHIMLATGTGFVIKQENSEYNDGNMICAFNFNGFLKKEELFSGKSTSQQILINDYSTDFYGELDDWDRKWDAAFKHLIGFTSGPRGSDFYNYIDEIYTGTSKYSEILLNLLTFGT